ncbi:MAG: PQQ-binding-like beta-propeller repeat protein [Planctomycetaceae bacterium]|nr:PQQ-binding-like beta-propeller repeat protein [Planctomycetaceae bacterium]
MPKRFPLSVVTALLCLTACGTANDVAPGDWPTWGGNAARNGVAATELPASLHLNWILQLREPDPAWHSNQDRVQFDRMYEPIVAGKRLLIGSMVGDNLTAYDTDTGKELWRFDTAGPVRLAPTVWNDRAYFACDDGHLYCVRVSDGVLDWKFFGGPHDRKALGNDRLISIYPARGAPVVYDGVVYFASSIWPFMGIFIHALDAQTGEVVWTNSGTGSMYILQQHDRPAFAGIAPQGYLVATEDLLLVSGGQTVPAAFDRRTGAFVHFNLNTREMGEKGGSGYHVRAGKDFFVTNEYMFRLSDGAYLARIDYPVITEQSLLSVDHSGVLHAYEHEMHVEKTLDRKGREIVKATLSERWSEKVEPALQRVHLQAGGRVFATGPDGLVAAVDCSEQTGDPKVTWSHVVEGEPLSLIAADQKLFVSTDRGALYCFSGNAPTSGAPNMIVHGETTPPATTSTPDEWSESARSLLAETGADGGYCLLLGIGSGRLLDELIAQSQLHVIALEPDAAKAALHRCRLDHAGLYGARAAVLTGDICSIQLPPYLASLIVSEDLNASGWNRGPDFVRRLFDTLRPYGGVACLPIAASDQEAFSELVSQADLARATVSRSQNGTHSVLTRAGALPGSANWTHQYADAGNSVMSADNLVKAPLGILWFGGPSNEAVLPRHGHGPTPQVAGGRLFIEGRDMLRAVDVYTGRLLWERSIPDLGQYYDYTTHEPGANAIGSNYVSLEDSVYVIHEDTCYRLDAATGEMLAEFQAPAATGEEGPPELGYLSVVGNVLIAGVQPIHFKTHAFQFRELRKYDGDNGRKLVAEMARWQGIELEPQREIKPEPAVLVENLNRMLFSRDFLTSIPKDVRARAAMTDVEQELQQEMTRGETRHLEPPAIALKRRLLERYYDLPVYFDGPIGTYGNWSRQSSRRLVGFDRRTGEILWTLPARYAFRHNAIAAGGNMVFALDRRQDAEIDHMQRRGIAEPERRRIVAIDLKSGREQWSTEDQIFGTWLGYSAEFDVLIQAGSAAGDRALDEVTAGIVAYQGEDGGVLWKSDAKYSGPLMLHHSTIYSQPGPGTAFDLLTGERKMRPHPLSGEAVPWTYSRDGGCNTAIASEHLITFRSSAAGFFDLAGDSGTGNWGGFRSSCTSNLIPADGVLNAPDYTRTCTCTFQNRSSLALVHMPEVETWTFNRFEWDQKRVRTVGLNFGAPGDRRSPDGVLWLDVPSVGGDSPDLPVQIDGESVDYFRFHPSHVSGPTPDWITCCGVTGASSITVTLDKQLSSSPRRYTVRLYFAEPDRSESGERVFDVRLQGRPVLTKFDIVDEASGPNQGITREFRSIPAAGFMKIELVSHTGRTLLCGVEILAED